LQTVNKGDGVTEVTFADPQGQTIMTLQFTLEEWYYLTLSFRPMTCEGIYTYLYETIKGRGVDQLVLVITRPREGESEISALLVGGITMKITTAVFVGLITEPYGAVLTI
jgi:hypothetical protein